ncbi:Reverse transcriptase-like protein [Varanus komodoensis]|nr:Reverse transcriptase-like protein [Varanus komodoensis]
MLGLAAQDFIASMVAMGLSQHVIGPTHECGHTLDLVFSTGQEEGGLRIRHKLDSTSDPEASGEIPMSPSGPKLMDEFQLLRSDDVDKVLERVVAGQLQALLDETDYLNPFQSGFRPGYGTESALVALYTDLCREKDRGSASLLVLLDLSVAFNTIDHGEAVAVLNQCLAKVMGWMRANKLKHNPDKTEVLLVGGLGFREGDLDLVLNGVALPLRNKIRSLGVLLNPELSLEAQVTAVARSTFFQLRLIHQLRPYLENDCLATVTRALVTSQLDFCNALYMGLPLKTVQILQLVQNRAARLLTGTGRYVHMTPVLHQFHWLPIEVQAQFKVLVITYKALNGLGPGYLKERLRPYVPSHSLRSAGEALLREPSMKDIRRINAVTTANATIAKWLANSPESPPSPMPHLTEQAYSSQLTPQHIHKLDAREQGIYDCLKNDHLGLSSTKAERAKEQAKQEGFFQKYHCTQKAVKEQEYDYILVATTTEEAVRAAPPTHDINFKKELSQFGDISVNHTEEKEDFKESESTAAETAKEDGIVPSLNYSDPANWPSYYSDNL